jgi:hypothetical protein
MSKKLDKKFNEYISTFYVLTKSFHGKSSFFVSNNFSSSRNLVCAHRMLRCKCKFFVRIFFWHFQNIFSDGGSRGSHVPNWIYADLIFYVSSLKFAFVLKIVILVASYANIFPSLLFVVYLDINSSFRFSALPFGIWVRNVLDHFPCYSIFSSAKSVMHLSHLAWPLQQWKPQEQILLRVRHLFSAFIYF